MIHQVIPGFLCSYVICVLKLVPIMLNSLLFFTSSPGQCSSVTCEFIPLTPYAWCLNVHTTNKKRFIVFVWCFEGNAFKYSLWF